MPTQILTLNSKGSALSGHTDNDNNYIEVQTKQFFRHVFPRYYYCGNEVYSTQLFRCYEKENFEEISETQRTQ
jgi:hypothetical protein